MNLEAVGNSCLQEMFTNTPHYGNFPEEMLVTPGACRRAAYRRIKGSARDRFVGDCKPRDCTDCGCDCSVCTGDCGGCA